MQLQENGDQTTLPEPCRMTPLRAFTLIEILVVVVILGILAGMVIILFDNPRRDTEQTAFAADGKSFLGAAIIYHARTGEFLEDGSSGQLPEGFAPYIDENAWTRQTPIGGVWDTEFEDNGITSALGVHFNGTGPTQNDDYMAEVDALVDDGDLEVGSFRKLADNRFYFIIRD